VRLSERERMVTLGVPKLNRDVVRGNRCGPGPSARYLVMTRKQVRFILQDMTIDGANVGNLTVDRLRERRDKARAQAELYDTLLSLLEHYEKYTEAPGT